MDKFEKFMAKPYELTLKTDGGEEEVFTLYPLDANFLPEVFKVFRRFASVEQTSKNMSEEEKTAVFLELLDSETIKLLRKLIMEMLKKSYPDKKEEVLSAFIMAHLMDLFPVFVQLHSFGGVPEDELKKLKPGEQTRV